MSTLVFVYGSLLRGLGNHGLLRRSRLVGQASTADRFTMGDLGTYPGVAVGGNTAIVGEAYEVDDETLARLDILEGHPKFYERVEVTVSIGEEFRTAWIYLLPRVRVVRLPRVRGGDWRAYLEGNNEEAVT